MDTLIQLQEEQNKKYAQIKMKKASQALSQSSKESVNNSLTFGIPDDLNLNANDVSASASVGLNVTLEAANTSMREEIRELQDETGRLRKSLAEREYEIRRLNKKILKCENEKRMLSDAGLATDSASTKIVELSKKNRDLTSQMETEKSKNVRFQQKINELERKLMNSSFHNAEDNTQASKVFNQSYSPRKLPTFESMDNLQDQLNSANLKISEYRNQVQSLKQDMKVAFKVLSLETGEDVSNIQSLIGSGGQGFRGRAQQVIALQDKVRDLERKLKLDFELNPRVDKNMMRIKNIEKTRKEQYDSLKESLNTLQDQQADTQRKWDASKARNKVLMSEVKSLKSQISVLTEKGSHDNELIATLMKQHENLQKLLERSSASKESSKKELVVNKMPTDLQIQESSEVKRLKQLLAEREMRIKELEEQVVNTSDSLDETHKPLSVFNTSNKDEDSANLRRKCIELKTLYDAGEVERRQLGRLVGSLNDRNEELTKQCEQQISNYHEMKRKCASLEHQIDNLKISDKSFTARESARPGVANELEAQLTIQRDENNALKEALQTTLRNKQSDVKMYQEMTQQTKQVFLDALTSVTSKK